MTSRTLPLWRWGGAACGSFAFLVPLFASSLYASPTAPCRIEVIEKGTGWPVPMVELRTTHNVRLVTDNAGVIALDLPEFFGTETWFDVLGHGYEVQKDGFGYRGVRLTPKPGVTLKVEVQRTIISRRLGRITGGGVFGESYKLGERMNFRDLGVLGCDSVQNAVHDGRLFWVWGDTTMARYPLGIFNGTGARTSLQPLSKFEPPLYIDFEYFRDARDFPRGVIEVPGDGPSWLTGFISLPGKDGEQHLVASVLKVKPPMEAYKWVLVEWNEKAGNFGLLKTLWVKSSEHPKAPPMAEGHPVIWEDAGKKWVLFGNPLPKLRCPASYEDWSNTNTWEILKPQVSLEAGETKADVKPHSGSVAYNGYRKRWVTIFMQAFGKPSVFGELWYAEADSPLGPWGRAVKVLSHENYTFYNPRIHPEFTAETSPVLIYEGTYTMQFSDNKQPTPRYDYNQVLYRLDLNDPRLAVAGR